ncbi:hypothetical protein SESBI_05627 [Sesbania bispinosa]|nr:hypothetical protein SESBI_05627 [Sesbania bispinosa]
MAMKIDSDLFATNASYAEPLKILMVDFEKVDLKDPTDGIIEQFEKEVTPIYPKAGRDTPMTKTQWRRYQRIKKAEQNISNQPQQRAGPSNFVQVVQKEVGPSTYAQVVQNGKQVYDKPTAPVEDVDNNMITQSFESGFPDDLEAICGVVSILPAEFAPQTLSQQEEEDFENTEFDYGSGPRKSKHKDVDIVSVSNGLRQLWMVFGEMGRCGGG